MDFDLTREEKVILLQVARESIRDHLGGVETKRHRVAATPGLRQKCGIFVTLHRGRALRGCIGFITSSKPLIELTAETAVASAFQDSRFKPLQEEELGEVEIELSVLSSLKRVQSIEEIQVGIHGIIVRCGFYSGLLLPQVATEHGWDRETFLSNTCYKAGLEDDCWRNPDTEIEVFSALVFNEKELGLID
jgi:AmmeMemoRadiSam system protein A